MGIKNEGTLKKSWFVITDENYRFSEIAEDYDYLISRYDAVAIGPADWDTKCSAMATGFRISATRHELMDLLRDFKETYPDAHVVVMRS